MASSDRNDAKWSKSGDSPGTVMDFIRQLSMRQFSDANSH